MEVNYRIINGVKFILKKFAINKLYTCDCSFYKDDRVTKSVTCGEKLLLTKEPIPESCVVTEFIFTIANVSQESFAIHENNFCMVDTGGNLYSNATKRICSYLEPHDNLDYGWSGYLTPIQPMTKATVYVFFPEIPNGLTVAYLVYKSRGGEIRFDFNSVTIDNDPDFYVPPEIVNYTVSQKNKPSQEKEISTKPAFFVEGFRDDLGLDIRSSWEANIARILKQLKLPFIYENEFFEFKYSDYKNRSVTIRYLPDFFIQPCNKTNDQPIIIEVKGTWDKNSRIKVREYQKDSSLPKLFLIDGDMYSTLSKLYSKIIPYWENVTPAKIESEKIQVVGINQEGRKEAVRSLYPGMMVTLLREPDNKFDKNAIKVITNDSNLVGYVSSDWAAVYAQKIDIGMQYSAEVIRIESSVITLQVKRNNPSSDILFDFLQ